MLQKKTQCKTTGRFFQKFVKNQGAPQLSILLKKAQTFVEKLERENREASSSIHSEWGRIKDLWSEYTPLGVPK